MGSLIFHVEADTLDTKVLDSIKAFFGGQKIQIAVKLESPHQLTEDELLAKVEAGQNADHEYHLSSEELKNFIEKAIATGDVEGESFRRIVPGKPQLSV